MSSVRILHIVTVPATVKWLIAPIIRRQVEAGYKVEVATGHGEYLEELKSKEIPIHVLGLSRRLLSFGNLATLWRLRYLIKGRQYHIVHTHTPVASFIGRLAAAWAGAPIIVYHMRGSWWDSPKAYIRLAFTLLERLPGLFTTHTFTINCADAREMVVQKVVKQESVTCLHCGSCGVDLLRFDPTFYSDDDYRNCRSGLGLSADDLVIGFIGRLVREKGIVDLLDAYKEIERSIPHARLLVIGDTLKSERDQLTATLLNEMILDSGLAAKVIFAGFRDDIPALINAMDIVTLPSYREGFGMVVAEAAAMAKPVIATSTRGGIEGVVHGETGLLVSPGDVNSLREALLTLSLDGDLRTRLGRAARLRAETHFSEEAVFNMIQEKYADMLNRTVGLPVQL
jgi:glycosyltransferase involved in cell wall biosynthesis